MYLLIDHNGKLYEFEDGERETFDNAEDAEYHALELNELDWMVVKFVSFT
jgi:hypothetical protein